MRYWKQINITQSAFSLHTPKDIENRTEICLFSCSHRTLPILESRFSQSWKYALANNFLIENVVDRHQGHQQSWVHRTYCSSLAQPTNVNKPGGGFSGIAGWTPSTLNQWAERWKIYINTILMNKLTVKQNVPQYPEMQVPKKYSSQNISVKLVSVLQIYKPGMVLCRCISEEPGWKVWCLGGGECCSQLPFIKLVKSHLIITFEWNIKWKSR